jgi:hypothetical protein
MATQSQVDQIDTILASGVGSISYMGRTVTYQNVADLLKIRAQLVDLIAATRRRRTGYVVFNKDSGS